MTGDKAQILPEYDERYCAFVDILGFRQLLAGLPKPYDPTSGKIVFTIGEPQELSLIALKGVLERIHTPQSDDDMAIAQSDFRAQSISDAVAISTARNAYGLSQLFFSLESLCLDLLYEGLFVRGAIVKGPLYHDGKMVFGPALSDAYELESRTVRFPRIMVSREVAFDAERFEREGFKDDFFERIKQAEDGPLFLHVLRQMEIELAVASRKGGKFDGTDTDELDRYKSIGRMIEGRFHYSVDNPRHFEKVQWFARYWNQCIPNKLIGFKRIEGVGLDPKK